MKVIGDGTIRQIIIRLIISLVISFIHSFIHSFDVEYYGDLEKSVIGHSR